jgi:RHS repeat-associated protein
MMSVYFIILHTSFGIAATEKEKLRKQGADLIYGMTFALEENMFNNLPSNTLEIKNTGKVILGIDHYNNKYIDEIKEITLIVNIKQWSDPSSGPVILLDKSLRINYDPNNSYNDLYLYKTEDCRKLEITVSRIIINGRSVLNMSYYPYIFLELEIETERYYSFDDSLPVVGIDHTYNNNTDQLNMHWNAFGGAESYELEYVAIDNYGYDSDGDPYEIDPANIEYNFNNNSTRISLVKNNYSIPLTFERGYLLYRIRAISVSHEYPEKNIYGVWSAPTYGFADHFPSIYYIPEAHEQNKTWSFSTTYAENGLKKDIVNYFDGSLRGRQTVSVLNTRKDAIIQENIYDYLGRAAIAVLPTPVNREKLEYYETFNVDQTRAPYSWENFDKDVDCSVSTESMTFESRGAANYYSNRSEFDPVTESYQAYVPNSLGFPFTQTEYTSDNTGRIKRQGGLGKDFQLSDGIEPGHENQYFYGQPNQYEIDRLFGTDAGHAFHYKKNMIIDANGQAAVTYLDLAGNTIATALAGTNPQALDALPSLNTGENVTITLMDWNTPSTSNRIIGNTIELNYRILTPAPGDYTITYQLGNFDFSPECSLGKCFDGVYDLEISITDNCGIELIESGKIEITIGDINQLDTLCQGGQLLVQPINVSFPKAGEYTFTKKLTLNQFAFEEYTAMFMDTANSRNNPCLPNLDDMIAAAVSEIDTTVCNFDCEEVSCEESLGDSYTNHKSMFGENALEEEEYITAMAECLEYCNPSNPVPSNSILNMLLADVYPGGQYASYDYYDDGSINATPYELSILNQANKLPKATYNGTNYDYPNWKYPIGEYLDKNNSTAYVTLNEIEPGEYNPKTVDGATIYYVKLNELGSYVTGGYTPAVKPQDLYSVSDFVDIFDENWCYALVKYHPEYAYYTWLEGNKEISFTDKSSDGFDQLILQTESFSDAYYAFGLTDYQSITDVLNNDPYFNGTGQGISQYLSMKTSLQEAKVSGSDVYNIKNLVAASIRCGRTYDEGEELPDIDHPCMKFGTGSDNDILDAEWEMYKYMYIKYKQILQQDAAHEYAINTGNGYNGCIGVGEDEFNHADRGFSNQYNTNELQPCHIDSYAYYASKQKRYVDRDIDPSIPEYAEDDPSLVEDLEDLIGGTTFLATGQCPVATHIVNLLNNLAKENELTATSSNPAELYTNLAFTPLLYNELNPGGGTVIEYQWRTSTNSQGDLLGEFFNGAGNDGHIYFEWLDENNPVCNWEDISFFFNFQFSEEIAGNYKFRVSVIYNVDENTQAQGLLFGETSFELNNCDENSFEYFEVSDFSEDMLSLWNVLFDEGTFLTPNVLLTDEPYISYITPEILFNLKNGGGLVHDHWNVVSNTHWEMRRISGDDHILNIDVLNTSPGFGYNYSSTLYFKNIRPFNSIENECRLTAVVSEGGVLNEYDIDIQVNLNRHQIIEPRQMIVRGTNYLLCDEPQVKVKEDFELFLNNLAESGNLTSLTSNIDETMWFSDLLISYVGTSEEPEAHYWYPTEVSDTILEAVITDYMPCAGIDNVIKLHTFNCNQTIDFSLIESFQNMSAIYTEGSNGVSTKDFLIEAVMADASIVNLYGSSTCFPLKNCDDCYDLFLPFTKDACLADYASLTASIYSPYEHDSVFIGNEEDFCEFNIGYSSDDYLFYISEINNIIGVNLLNLVDPIASPLFISLNEYCTNGYSHSENSLEPYYSQFLSTVNAIHTLINEPLVIGESPYFFSIREFSDNNFALCVSCYIDYINELGPTPVEVLTIEEFTLNNMCTMIPRDDCPKMPPNIYFSPTSEYVNPCVKELTSVATAGVYGDYYALMDSIRNAFILEYRTACLQVPEYLKMEYSDAEYHYTLYYYDRAGNLVKTIPPEGVKPITNQSTLNDITLARETNNNSVILPHHILPTKYRYNSQGLLNEQSTPDAGKSIFRYDILGRLRFSQNSKQSDNGFFSYTRYDEHGRIVETGESNQTTGGYPLIHNSVLTEVILNNNTYPSIGKINVTRTIYDLSSTNYIEQKNLRSRVAAIAYDNGGNGLFDFTTHFSYDMHGNVDVLLQENAALSGTDDNFKRIDYEYGMISGNVNKVSYQHGKYDASYHKYYYDADNRITEVYTSKDDEIWKRDARYIYYKHGPLARTEIGDMKVQGIDYAYTIHGWLKGVNSNTLVASRDIGRDGDEDNMHQYFGRDAYGFSLDYYPFDYIPEFISGLDDIKFLARNGENDTRALYNGNISSVSSINHHYISKGKQVAPDWHPVPSLVHYSYDQLNRITASNVYSSDLVIETNNWAGYANPGIEAFNTTYEYDANGNILDLYRNGIPSQEPMDDLSYIYDRVDPLDDESDLLSNKLLNVTDAVTASGYDNDITTQILGNYDYDNIGNIIFDKSEEIAQIDWNVANKIVRITRNNDSKLLNLQFEYDGLGNRVTKQTYPGFGTSDDIDYTWYVRDALGNIMAVYNWKGIETPRLTEISIYGSNRLGYVDATKDRKGRAQQSDFYHISGVRKYELSNHLGNVMTVVTDRPVANISNTGNLFTDYYTADFVSSQEYYPFGSLVPGLNTNTDEYRFGFNGMEKDDEVSGNGNQYDYGFRIYNPRIARFLSVDPLTANYPWYTPFQFAGNKPIKFIDLDGLEEADPERKNSAMQAVLDFENDESIEGKQYKAIRYLNKNEIVGYLKSRLKDPAMRSHFNSCGPTAVAYITITHDPLQFVNVMLELWEKGNAMNGKLSMPDNLSNSDKHYYNNDDIDQLLEGTLRYSENTFGGYFLKKPKSTGSKWKDNLRLFRTNATTPGEFDDFFRRMSITVETSSFNNITMDDIGNLSKLTSSGQYVVFFGYFQAMRGNTPTTNIGGGDHFVSVTSIVQNKNGTINVSYWHHGEYQNNGYENRTYTTEEFQEAFKEYSVITNTGNNQE